MTTCPSGVHYMHLVDHGRHHIEETYARPLPDRLVRRWLAWLMPGPAAFRWSLVLGRLAKPLALDARARVLGRCMPQTPGRVETAVAEPGPMLFDPEALRGLFGSDPARLAGLLNTFRDGVRRDGEAVAAALAAGDLEGAAAAAHRLKGAARMAGARPLADLLSAVEQASRDGRPVEAGAAASGLASLAERTVAATLEGE